MYASLELYNMCICDNHFDNNSTAILNPKLNPLLTWAKTLIMTVIQTHLDQFFVGTTTNVGSFSLADILNLNNRDNTFIGYFIIY